ncbi:MAG: sugar kinase [Chloroflexi bacterium]|nr:sugar kinase [Chloroflexota bacterium]
MNQAKPPTVIAAGEVMVELAGPKPLARVETIKRSNSGDVLNVAVALGRLGLPCAILTKVGDDPFGDYLLEDWAGLGVDQRYVTRGDGPTGLYVAEHAADASYQIWYWRKGSAASTIAPADVDRVDLGGVRLVHLSGISQAISASSRAATRRLAERARERGIPVSLDINFRPQIWSGEEAAKAMHEVLPDANLVFCGAPDESLAVAGLPDPEDAARYFLDQGAEVVAVTMAENGALAADAGETVRLPHVARRIQGPQGAGDAFVGGFLAGRLAGAGLATCTRFGTLVAGLKVERPGPLHGLPQRPEIVARAAELGWDDVLRTLDVLEADSDRNASEVTG